jgi:protein SCO1/2
MFMKYCTILLGCWLIAFTAMGKDRDASNSVYALDSTWQDGRSQEFKFASLQGKVRVLAMGYTSCQYACPRILADMRAIERGLGTAAEQVAFTFVSFDSKNDTPAHLKTFQAKQHLPRWTFLTGDEDSVLELSVLLGVKFQKLPDGNFAHSNTIFVISADGRILHRQEALGAKPDASMAAIRKALANPKSS